MMKLKIILEPSAEGGYSVTVHSLPCCISEGDTREKVIHGTTAFLSVMKHTWIIY